MLEVRARVRRRDEKKFLKFLKVVGNITLYTTLSLGLTLGVIGYFLDRMFGKEFEGVILIFIADLFLAIAFPLFVLKLDKKL